MSTRHSLPHRDETTEYYAISVVQCGVCRGTGLAGKNGPLCSFCHGAGVIEQRVPLATALKALQRRG